MTKLFASLAAALVAASISGTAQAAPAKTMHGKMASGKMVSLYQADRCHMYFTAAQAKQFKYACPDSMGKMKMVKVSSAVAKMELAKTSAALAPKKAM
jgi:hypothetical protein